MFPNDIKVVLSFNIDTWSRIHWVSPRKQINRFNVFINLIDNYTLVNNIAAFPCVKAKGWLFSPEVSIKTCKSSDTRIERIQNVNSIEGGEQLG